MKILFLMICCLVAASGISVEPGDRARAFYAIKDYQKARDIYQEMLVNPLPAWEKAVILYNIGTVLMSEGRWSEAREQFQSIALGKDPSPLLVRYLKTNIALNTLRQSYDLMLNPPYDADKVAWLLDRSHKDFQEANQAECAFEALAETNGKECVNPQDLVEMTNIISLLMFDVNQVKRENLVQSLKSNQWQYVLLEEAQKAVSSLDFLQHKDLPSDLKDSYNTFFYNQFSSHLQLWNNVGPQARDSFAEGLHEWKQGNMEHASRLLNDALNSLKQSQQKTSKANSELQNLEEILFRYRLALAQEPLNVSLLESLLKDQQSLFPKTPANGQLDQSIHLLVAGKEEAARFFIQGALGEISSLTKIEKYDPKSILKSLITEQEHAMAMTALFQKIPSVSEKDIQLLLDSQKMPIQGSDAFVESSLSEQRVSYEKEGQCQWNMWKSVFPLFNQGYVAANQASSHLTRSVPDALGALPVQDHAVNKWREALNELNNKKNISEEAQKTAESIPPPMQHTINEIQEMNLQDKVPQEKKPVTTEKGIRPW